MTFIKSKTGIAVVALIAVFAFLYFFTGVFGDTRISLTLNTNPDLERGLVGHWTFDGPDVDIGSSTAEVKDRSVNNYTGDWVNHASSTVPGVLGQAIDFDGVDDYVRIDNPFFYATTEHSIALWVKGASQNDDDVCGGGQDSILYSEINQSGSLPVYKFVPVGDNLGFCYKDDTGATFSTSTKQVALDNSWHHIVWTDINGTAFVYIDGILDSVDFSYTPGPEDFPALIHSGIGARENPNVGGNFDGTIDDVRIYNRVLSQEEVTRLYELGATTFINTTITTNPDLERGLVGHWTFDGPDLINNAVDRSGQGNTGYLTNFTSTTTRAGVLGQALEFDGSDDYIDIPSFSGVTGSPLSIAVWVKPNTNNCDTEADCMIIVGNADSGVQLGTNDGIEMRFCRNFSQCVTVAISNYVVGEWQHLILVADGTNCNMYKNGVFLNSNGCTGTGMSPVRIGDHIAGTRAFDGLLDDVRVYNRALSTSEITRLYELGATTKIAKTITTNPDLERGLVGHWTFDGPDLINNATDRSGQGNTGYLENFTSTTTRSGKIGQALEFDGSDDYVEVPYSATLNQDAFTVSAWAKVEGSQGNFRSLITSRDISPTKSGYIIYAGSNDNWQFWIGDPVNSWRIITGNSVVVDEWIYLTAIYDGSDMIFYNNGVKVAGPTTFSLAKNTQKPLRIGAGATESSPVFHFNGTIDDVRVYNRALSAEEILRLYQLGN